MRRQHRTTGRQYHVIRYNRTLSQLPLSLSITTLLYQMPSSLASYPGT